MRHQTIALAGALISCVFMGYYLHIITCGSIVYQNGGPTGRVSSSRVPRATDSRRVRCLDYNDMDVFHEKEQVDKLVMNEFFRGISPGPPGDLHHLNGKWDGKCHSNGKWDGKCHSGNAIFRPNQPTRPNNA